MYPDLELLIPLQALDIEAKRLRDEMQALPRRVAAAEATAKDAAARRTKLREELATEETLRRRLESDIADLRVKVDRTRKKVDTATTEAQVTALEHELGFARAEIARLEDVELESMERSETLEVRMPVAEEELRLAEAAVARERDRAQQMLAADKAALAEIEAKRDVVRTELLARPTGDTSLDRYDRIAKARGTAISEALLGKCTACGMMLRPQLWQDLRDNGADSPSRTTLTSCENCGRLLYYDPARDAPQRKPVQGESIAASIVRSSI